MKIEMIVPALPQAGMELVVASLTRGFARRGHDVGVTCIQYRGPVADLIEAEGSPVTLVPSPGLRTILWPANLRRWLKQRSPDVVHVHSGAWLKSVRAARMAGITPVIYTMHGIDGSQPWYVPLLERWAARGTTAAVAVSVAFVPYLSERVGVRPGNLHVIANGIDIERFRPGMRTGRVRGRYGLNGDDLVIGHVARFSAVKNHAVLIAAFAEVLHVHPKAFLALVGDGPLRSDIEARVDALGIRSRVGFLGRLGDLPEVYRDFDLLTLPSFSEASSMSLLEGMACGLPIVATAVGGTPDLLGQGEAGALVPNDDARSLAAALITLAGEPDARARLGQAARQRAESRYSEDRMLDAYEALYAGAATGA